MIDYSNLSQEEFYDILYIIVKNNDWDVPGVIEILAEYYNNDVLDFWAEKHELSKSEEE